jgi:uncharacterized protein (TIRG00374 family)
LLLHKSGLRPIGRQLGSADAAWLAIGFGFAVLSVGLTVLQWQKLLGATGVRRTYGRCLHLELAGDVFDAALPSSVGGDVVRAVMVSSRPDERVHAAASVLLRRLLNFPGMVLLMGVGLLATLDLSYAGKIRPYALVAVLGGTAIVVVLVSPLLGWLSRQRPFTRGPFRIAGKLMDALNEVRGRRRDLLLAAGRGIAFWSLVSASQWSFMRAVGIHVPLTYGVVVVTTTNAITMLPISLGGYGLREGAFAAFLAVGGLATTAQGVAVGVCLTGQTVVLGLAGIPFYLTVNRARRAQIDPAPADPVPAVSGVS